MTSKSNTRKYFHAALTAILNEKGWGSQSSLPRKTGIKQQVISRIVKDGNDNGCTEETRIRIAEGLGYEHQDFLELGRKLSGDAPPDVPLRQVMLSAELFDMLPSFEDFIPVLNQAARIKNIHLVQTTLQQMLAKVNESIPLSKSDYTDFDSYSGQKKRMAANGG